MSDDLSPEETLKVLQALNEAVDSGPWDKSLFLSAIGKKIKDIREQFVSELKVPEEVQTAAHLANRVALRTGQQEVFVSVYNVSGDDINKWEQVLHTLAHQSVTRPTYSTEKDVREMIRSKENKINEAYVSVYINKKEILPVPKDRVLRDKLGIALLTLKEKAIKNENIIRFFHKSGQYIYDKGNLIRQGDVEYADFN